MIKVLHLVYSGLGGASSVVFSLIEADKKKYLNQSILFIGPKLNKYFPIKCKKLRVQFSWIKTFRHSYFFSSIFVFNQIRRYEPDIVLIHNYYFISCILYKIFFKKLKIIYVNHTPLNLMRPKDMLIKYFHIFLDRFVFINKSTFVFARNNFKICFKKICVITNGINVDFFAPIYVKKSNVFKIGMACRVNRLKHYDLIANAINSNLLKNYNIQFLLAGDGEDLSKFKIRVKKLGIQKKIKYLGNLNEIQLKKWYADLNLYIQASTGEGISISLIQAMSMEIPVIGSRVTGIQEVLKKKYVGQLFDNNIQDLANKIKYFYLMNKNEKLKYIKTQRKHVIIKYNYKKMFAKYFFQIKNIASI